ncbi:uncharacterized protein METZ01_LOCUS259169, partial [marine metagenome]
VNRLYAIIIVATLSFSFAAIRTEKSDHMGRLRFLTGRLHYITGDLEVGVRSYLFSIRNQLGHKDAHAFPLDYHKNGKNNTQHFTFQQTYNNIPVFGRYIHVHTNDEIITSLSSNIETINLSVFPRITEVGAIDIIHRDYIFTSTYLKYKNLQIYIQNSIPYLIHTIDAVGF